MSSVEDKARDSTHNVSATSLYRNALDSACSTTIIGLNVEAIAECIVRQP
jgi:hypothetical protein